MLASALKYFDQSLCDFFNYHPLPWRDSISRQIAPQAETVPLDHAARDLVWLFSSKNKLGFRHLRTEKEVFENRAAKSVQTALL
jgi:hypothetical protein